MPDNIVVAGDHEDDYTKSAEFDLELGEDPRSERSATEVGYDSEGGVKATGSIEKTYRMHSDVDRVGEVNDELEPEERGLDAIDTV